MKDNKLVTFLVVGALLLVVPLVAQQFGNAWVRIIDIALLYVLLALGLNIVVGYAGLLDLGYVGFYAVGAYVVAVLTSQHASWPWLATIPVAVAVTMLSGVLLGAPTLRVRGDYLAIVTLGFGEIIRLTAVNTDWLGAAAGIPKVGKPPSWSSGTEGGVIQPVFEIPKLDWSTGTPLLDTGNQAKVLVFGVIDIVPYYWLALTVVIAMLFADRLIKDSRVGRAWEATREDEDAAELMGVPTFKFKLLAFAMGAFVGGLAGSLFAGRQGFVSPQSFPILLSILFLAAVVIGGSGNRWGAIVGAIIVGYLPERIRFLEDTRYFFFGLALMILAIYRPQGILPPRRRAQARKLDKRLDQLEGQEVSGG